MKDKEKKENNKDKKDKVNDEVREGDLGHKKSKVIDFEIQAAENLAGWQGVLADYQNLQKEMDKRLANMNDFVSANFILELLPIFDNYQVAISHVPESEKKESWAVGLEYILKMWEGLLAEHDVSKIETINNQFDTNLHEAVGQISDEDQEDQIIVEEKVAGYMSKEKVIRPAKVIINNN